jgi:hypothetical protein
MGIASSGYDFSYFSHFPSTSPLAFWIRSCPFGKHSKIGLQESSSSSGSSGFRVVAKGRAYVRNKGKIEVSFIVRVYY